MTDPSHLHIVPPVDYDTRPNLFASLNERERKALDGYREPVLDRAARAFGSERTFFFILGGYVGALLTMALAFAWALVL